MHKCKYEDTGYYSFKIQADIFLHMKRVDILYHSKIRQTFLFTYEEGKYFFEATRAEIFIFHHDWAEIFFGQI